ncbi:MAG TPA: NAD-dependent epimerase/dehydratase family protein [Nitrospirae bacterium]|nr:UDP-glucose 4-epimerase [bacterium BMS3Abin10]GBE39570.1 UDP-glucose 4-epimerase [bacterium BMS3Bbin08]HDH50220.1 NAD-dependent epimerase/dehydratase family protein [Nitrospirota bacterium]HDK16755.1 NAD-dependent epimerase/dehydratase family protein [Nitrospirota bacterium]HDK81212.1 NAD-dependent epimerase/dehydratase family protein [Nitrospirota bacterium]
MIFQDKKILITGGTGSLGQKLVSRILTGELGMPSRIRIFSRDEAKQHQMRLNWKQKPESTDEIIYRVPDDVLEFQIGDIRDIRSVRSALRDMDIVINAAAMKQVPTCEYFPFEAVQTNIHGASNIVSAIADNGFKVDTVVGVSTDKACKPVNVMGMTKSIQERIFIEWNLKCPRTRFVCTRYGNVLASRGSVIPLFIQQIKRGGPITITTPEMTRFLMGLDEAINTIFAAIRGANPGETYIPKIPSARIADIVDVMLDGRKIEIQYIDVRPGEKTHEILISEEECHRTIDIGGHFVIEPILPEIRSRAKSAPGLAGEYTSADNLMSTDEIRALLRKNRLFPEEQTLSDAELAGYVSGPGFSGRPVFKNQDI